MSASTRPCKLNVMKPNAAKSDHGHLAVNVRLKHVLLYGKSGLNILQFNNEQFDGGQVARSVKSVI